MKKDWISKMKEFEAQPPAAVWQKIASALDDSHLADRFPQALHDLTLTPPLRVWKKISSALSGERPLVRRMAPWVRYAAAAVLLAVISFAGIQLLNREKTGAEQTESKLVPEKFVSPPQEEQARRDERALEESKSTLARLETPIRRNVRAVNYTQFLDPVAAETFQLEARPEDMYREREMSLLQYAPSVEPEVDLAKRYVMLITPDGNIIRMSRKLGDLVCCVSGEDQDEACRSQLEKWRTRLATAPGNSPGNFLDILHLVNSLQAEK